MSYHRRISHSLSLLSARRETVGPADVTELTSLMHGAVRCTAFSAKLLTFAIACVSESCQNRLRRVELLAPLRATGCQLPCGITVICHPTQVNTLRFNPSQPEAGGTRFIYPGGMEGWVYLGDQLAYITETVYPPTDSHGVTLIPVLTRQCRNLLITSPTL